MTVLGAVRALWTDRTDGDQRTPAGPAVASVLGPRRLVVARQVHGSSVELVAGPAEAGAVADRPADALVCADPGVCVAVVWADCGALALASPEGIFGAVHAGWRGLVSGVVEAAVGTMRTAGASRVVGALGPCIHPECYEFGPAELALVADRYGPGVRGTSRAGRPALDLPAALSAAMAAAGVDQADGPSWCTGCSDRHYSHRARGDEARHALLVWSEGPVP